MGIDYVDTNTRQEMTVWAENKLGSVSLPTFVTPESLLAYCQSRLRDLDRGIQERFAAEQKTINLQKGLGALKDLINGAAQDGICSSERDVILAKVEELKKLTDDPELKARLDAIGISCTTNMNANDATNGPIKAIDELGKDLGAGRELSMIELQSVVSQRQTALQLTTNLMNTINQSSQSIVQNIK